MQRAGWRSQGMDATPATPPSLARFASERGLRADGFEAAGMAIEQELAHLHHPVNPLVISRQRLALDDSVDSSRRLACIERCKGLRKSSSFCKPRSGRMPLG